MVPTLRPGDEIAVEPTLRDVIRVGDLILFEQRGQLICHRLVEISDHDPALLTRADAAHGGGEQVDWNQVLGKVVAIRRRTLWLGLKHALARPSMPLLLRWLPTLQRLTAYRVLVRPLVAPYLSYHLGLVQGSRWYRWQALGGDRGTPVLPPSERPHLLVAKRGTHTVGWAGLAWRDAHWHCEDPVIRIRYRGLSLETDLTRRAHQLMNAQ